MFSARACWLFNNALLVCCAFEGENALLLLVLHALLAACRSDDATVRLWTIDGCVERASAVLDHVSSDSRDVQGVSALEWDVRMPLPCFARSLVLNRDLNAAYRGVSRHGHAARNRAYLGRCRYDCFCVDVGTKRSRCPCYFTGKLIAAERAHSTAVMAVRWNPSGSLLLSGGLDGAVVVYSNSSLAVYCRAKFHSGACSAGSSASDGLVL